MPGLQNSHYLHTASLTAAILLVFSAFVLASSAAFAGPAKGGKGGNKNPWVNEYLASCAYFNSVHPECLDYQLTAEDINDIRSKHKNPGKHYHVKVCAFKFPDLVRAVPECYYFLHRPRGQHSEVNLDHASPVEFNDRRDVNVD